MSKYIDLAEQIHTETRDGVYLDEVEEVLSWLDRNPDQTPGRIITESEWVTAAWKLDANMALGFKLGLNRLGITVVPDPEPTNAEKLADILQAAMQEDGWGDEGEANILAAALEAAGVKAMGGDE